ncbi:hypothetical protein A4G99_05210 [Haladaptatus sp. R4]|nr:hypothetical protein A4G99_05210 [Haladaptatus sp. R4]
MLSACRSSAFLPVRFALLPHGKWLARDEFAVELGMFGEVVDEYVTSPAGQSPFVHVIGGERPGKPVVQVHQYVEALEHLSMTSGIGTATRDDVTAVIAVLPRRVEVFAAFGQRSTENLPQVGCLASGEFVCLAGDGQRHAIVRSLGGDWRLGGSGRVVRGILRRISGTSGREFLDQSPRGDLLYPPSLFHST